MYGLTWCRMKLKKQEETNLRIRLTDCLENKRWVERAKCKFR